MLSNTIRHIYILRRSHDRDGYGETFDRHDSWLHSTTGHCHMYVSTHILVHVKKKIRINAERKIRTQVLKLDIIYTMAGLIVDKVHRDSCWCHGHTSSVGWDDSLTLTATSIFQTVAHVQDLASDLGCLGRCLDLVWSGLWGPRNSVEIFRPWLEVAVYLPRRCRD